MMINIHTCIHVRTVQQCSVYMYQGVLDLTIVQEVLSQESLENVAPGGESFSH